MENMFSRLFVCVVTQALRAGRLNGLCNQTGDVVLVVNRYYAGLFREFIKLFRQRNIGEEYSGILGREVAETYLTRPEG